LEKYDYYYEFEDKNKKGYSHILFDSYNRFMSETDEIYDYLPNTASKTYNCLANSLRDGKLIGKTKLLIEKPNSQPHVIKYIFFEKNEEPVELHEYHNQHHSGLIFRLNSGSLK
jgi:hypothetical protein